MRVASVKNVGDKAASRSRMPPQDGNGGGAAGLAPFSPPAASMEPEQ